MCISDRVQLRGPARLLSGPGAGVVVELTRLPRCPEPACGQGCPPLCSLSWKQQDKPSDHCPLPGGEPQHAAEQDARLEQRYEVPPPGPPGGPPHTHTPPLLRPSGPGSVIISTVSAALPGQRKPVLTAALRGSGQRKACPPLCPHTQTHALLCDRDFDLLLPRLPRKPSRAPALASTGGDPSRVPCQEGPPSPLGAAPPLRTTSEGAFACCLPSPPA